MICHNEDVPQCPCCELVNFTSQLLQLRELAEQLEETDLAGDLVKATAITKKQGERWMTC